MSRTFLALAATIMVAATASAQIMSAEISPPSARPGQPITLTVSPNQPVTLSTGCAATSIRDDINGNHVTFYACPLILVNLAPCATYSQTWNQQDQFGNQVPPGTYWFEVSYFTSAGSFQQEWFCFRIEAANSNPPTLRSLGPLVQGTTTLFEIDSPSSAGSFYLVLASLTSNTGLPFGADRLCLDNDVVLAQTVPVPNPAAFINFQGFLDPSGFAGGIAVNMPSFPPGVSCIPFHTQAILVDLGLGTAEVTNGITHTIL